MFGQQAESKKKKKKKADAFFGEFERTSGQRFTLRAEMVLADLLSLTNVSSAVHHRLNHEETVDQQIKTNTVHRTSFTPAQWLTLGGRGGGMEYFFYSTTPTIIHDHFFMRKDRACCSAYVLPGLGADVQVFSQTFSLALHSTTEFFVFQQSCVQ